LAELERLSETGSIDLYYGDQTGVSTEGYCPYGWQGKDEKVSIAALPQSRQRLNCMGWISRDNRFYYATTTENINGDFIFEHLELFSWQVRKTTFLVLDNARIHKTPAIRAQMKIWEDRGLHLFFLPPYSPHLNIAETVWRMLKGKWLTPADYLSPEALFYAAIKCLDAVGNDLKIRFSTFTHN
jgi:transposase